MSAYSARVISDGAVGYWRLGESAGTTATDQTGYSNGTYTNTAGVTLGQAGVSDDTDTGVRLTQSSKGYVAIPDVASQRVGDNLTIEFWFQLPTVYAVQLTQQSLFDSQNDGGPAVFLNPSGTITVSKSAIVGGFSTSTWWTALSDGYVDRLWHHFVFTKNGSAAHTYIDGVDVTDALNNPSVALGNATGYLIGKYHGSATLYFADAMIDEVAVYPTALSSSTVEDHYGLAFVVSQRPVLSFPKGARFAAVEPSEFSQTPASVSYQWNRNGIPIHGATDTLYAFQPDDSGEAIDCTVTGTSAAGTTATRQSLTYASLGTNGIGWTRHRFSFLPLPTVGSDEGEPSLIIEGGYFKLWFTQRGQGIKYATCPTTLDPTLAANWNDQGVVVVGASSSFVFKDGSTYRMYHYVAGATSDLFTRTSSDGITWSSTSVAIAHNAVAWSQGWAGSFVWKEGSTYKMLMDASLGGDHWGCGYATSSDGVTFTPGAAAYTTLAVVTNAGAAGSGPWLLNAGQKMSDNLYHLIFHGSTSTDQFPDNLYHATSPDVATDNWTIRGVLISHNPGDSLSSDQVADPCLVESGGTSYLFHTGTPAPLGTPFTPLLATFPGTIAEFLAGSVAEANLLPFDRPLVTGTGKAA